MAKEALTASRMACWTLCQRKHLFAYDRGVRKIESGDALVFGTAWHKAQEVYYGQGAEMRQREGFTTADMAQAMFEAAAAATASAISRMPFSKSPFTPKHITIHLKSETF